MAPRTSQKDYKNHQYSGPRKNRRRIRAQMKRYHGEIKSRNEVWCKKIKTDDSSVPSNSLRPNNPVKTYSNKNRSRKRKMESNNGEPTSLTELVDREVKKVEELNKLQQDGASCSAITSAAGPETTVQNDQELCVQIRNNLKKLRRLETGEADSEEENNVPEEPPSLNMEVFTEETENTENMEIIIDKFESDTENAAKDEPNAELEQSKSEKKPAKKKPDITKRVKPKRNPRRSVVIEQEIRKSIMAARKAPAVEKIFVGKSVNGKPTEGTSKKQSHEVHFDLMEQLYEYGKHIAEQLISFDENDIQSAKTEINEVLTKYRLKYKIMNCLTKPTNGESRTGTNKEETERPPKKTGRLGVISRPRVQPIPNIASKSVKRKSTGHCSCPPKHTETNTPKHAMPHPLPRLPQLVSVVPSLKEMGKMQTKTLTGVTPLGFVIVPTMNAPGFHITTQRVDSTGSLVSQPVNLQGTSSMPARPQLIATVVPVNLSGSSKVPGTSVIRPGYSVGTSASLEASNVSTGPLDTRKTLERLLTETQATRGKCESAESEPGLAHVKIVESLTGSSQTSPGKVSPRRSSLETPAPPFQMPQTHFVNVVHSSDEPESLVVKCEAESDEEEDNET